MATILVLDDVPDYCEELAAALSRDGNILRSASNAREAIDAGVMLEPDVLITDWMLANHVNGLDVAEVLRQVYPSMKTILMTGYASNDLIEDAKQFGVTDFLEKPFSLDSIRKALERAQTKVRTGAPPMQIGIIETFPDGTIGHSNFVAEEMMSNTSLGAFAVRLSEYFSPEEWTNLQRKSLTEWVSLAPLGTEQNPWHLRSKVIQSSGLRVWALLNASNVELKNSAINLRLLGFAEDPPSGLEHCGHVLIVNGIGSARRFANEMLRAMKVFCHTAEDEKEATRIFAHDPDTTHVILERSKNDTELKEFIQRIKQMRPNVCLIGSGLEQDKKYFSELGVNSFLAKPWDYHGFLQILRAAQVH